MTFDPWYSLAAFFTVYGIEPGTPETLALSEKLISQEMIELDEALERLNQHPPGSPGWIQARADFAQETSDVIYVLCFRAYARGVDLGPVLDRVQEANMSKVWDDGEIHKDADGKVLKPPTWVKPDFVKILAEQVTRHPQAA